jgi:hypothetical protein
MVKVEWKVTWRDSIPDIDRQKQARVKPIVFIHKASYVALLAYLGHAQPCKHKINTDS